MTGGFITRNNLAKRILYRSLPIAQEDAIDTGFFGEHTREIVRTGRSILFHHSINQANNAHLVQGWLNSILESMNFSKPMQCIAKLIINKNFGATVLQDSFVERVLTTLTDY